MTALLGSIAVSTACHGPVPVPATAPQLATYVGCFDLVVTTDSASMPDSFPTGSGGRHSVAVPSNEGEERFWLYLSAQEIKVQGGEERGLLAVRPHIDPTEMSAWRMLAHDTVVAWFVGYGTWEQVLRFRGSSDTLSGRGESRTHMGYRSYSQVRATRRACPADSLSAGDTIIDLPSSAT